MKIKCHVQLATCDGYDFFKSLFRSFRNRHGPWIGTSELRNMLYIYIRTDSKVRTFPADLQERLITNTRFEAEKDYSYISPDFLAVVNWLTIHQVDTTSLQFSQCTGIPA